MLMDAIAEWVRSNRVAKSWTQLELAKRVGVDSGTVSRWERGGFPNLKQFRLLCVHFECSADPPLGLRPVVARRRRVNTRTEASA